MRHCYCGWQRDVVVNTLVLITEVALHRAQLLLTILDQLSLSSLWGWLMEYQAVWLWLRWGVFTCVGGQVTLCDPVW